MPYTIEPISMTKGMMLRQDAGLLEEPEDRRLGLVVPVLEHIPGLQEEADRVQQKISPSQSRAY